MCDIIAELSVGMTTEGIDVRSVGNTLTLHETALVEAFNLKAAIEYQLKNCKLVVLLYPKKSVLLGSESYTCTECEFSLAVYSYCLKKCKLREIILIFGLNIACDMHIDIFPIHIRILCSLYLFLMKFIRSWIGYITLSVKYSLINFLYFSSYSIKQVNSAKLGNRVILFLLSIQDHQFWI